MKSLCVSLVMVVLFVACEERNLSVPQNAVEVGVRFTSIRGRVEVKRAGTLEWINATLAVTVQKDDLVQTFKNATAKLRFADGTEFDVRPDSLITIFENSRDPVSAQPRVGVSIQSGEANFQTPAQAGERRIETPSGHATPERETEGNVRVARDGQAAVRIYKGKGRVDSRTGQQIQLGPSEGVQIDAEGKAGPKVPLLTMPNPTALAPPPDQVQLWTGVLRPPQLALGSIELKGAQLHVTGRTEPDATVTLNGVQIPVQRDGSFNEHVVLDERSVVVSIQVTGIGGATTEQRLPIVASR